MHKTQRSTASSNSRFQAVPSQQYSANLSLPLFRRGAAEGGARPPRRAESRPARHICALWPPRRGVLVNLRFVIVLNIPYVYIYIYIERESEREIDR